jgi:UDPglucose 6-dehydrogenase
MEALWRVGAKVRAYDPVALKEALKLYGDREELVLCSERDKTLEGAEALVIVTEWDEFRQPDFQLIKDRLVNPIIFDGRNILSCEEVRSHEIEYYGIGKL